MSDSTPPDSEPLEWEITGDREVNLAPGTPVVTAFLHRGARILVLRRSAKVSTYRGRWAGVSGFAQDIPLRQAYTELAEEVSLAGSEVRLQGVGAPLRAQDAEGRRWLVYPFLFEVPADWEPRLDWENMESRWVEPEAVTDLDTVPGLSAALGRVWPPLVAPRFWQRTAAVALNTTEGATALGLRVLRILNEFLARHGFLAKGTFLKVIRSLASLRPSMGIFPHLMARVCAGAASGEDPRLTCTDLEGEIEKASKALVGEAYQRLRGCRRVLTHSYSRACRDTLVRWAGGSKRKQVFCTESRPGGEGRRLVRELAAVAVSARLIPDAEAEGLAGQVDAVVVGGDAVALAHYETAGQSERRFVLLNKVGTARLAAAARAAGTAVYALCITHKVAPPGWPLALEKHGAASEKKTPLRDYEVVFDATPLSNLTALLGEQGELSEPGLREIRQQLGTAPLLPE